MTTFRFLAVAVLAAGIGTAVAPAFAASSDDEGFAALHTKVRAAGKVCFGDHFHVGTGAGTNKKQAMADAIRSWSGFTAWEYGRRWGSWKLAADKTTECLGSEGQSVTCHLRARPCRPGK